MRILQLHNTHQSKGGAPEVLAHEAGLLVGAGHAVEQYILAPAAELGLSSARAGLKAIWNVQACREVARRIGTFGPDVVHVHTPYPLMSPAVFRTAAGLGVPTVTTLHSFRNSCIAATCYRDGGICEDCIGTRLKLPGLRHRCYHDSLGASAALTTSLVLHRHIGTLHHKIDKFIALTGFARRLLIRDGIPESKITVKPNSVADPGTPERSEGGRPYVLFAGRLVDVKGIATLLDAWPRVGTGLLLRIAGDGPLRPLVEQRAGADDSIEYLGWVSEQTIGSLLAGALFTVVPSEWYEGLPLIVLRSLSYGTPLVVSDLENLSEDVLADEAGVAFEVGTPASLARVLSRAVADRELLARLRVNARQSYLRRYSTGADLDRLTRIYDEVIKERAQ